MTRNEAIKLAMSDVKHKNLSEANLSWADLRGANLRGANLSEAYLRGADLHRANLHRANLRVANLSWADLRGANLSEATLPNEVPVIPDIHLAVFGAANQPGALDMSVWHNSCGTTHCRAGWAVTLAGEPGKALEEKLGTPTAAALIYQASDPILACIPNFYASNHDALTDMQRLAEGR